MEALALHMPMTFEDSQRLVRIDDELADALRRVEELDFSMLKRKLLEEKGWTVEVCEEVEGLYRKFLALNMRYPDRKICPSGPIDEFWHAHILDTRAYAADCERLFGRMLHHFPYFGMRGPDDRAALEEAFSASIDLFIVHFGIDPTAGDSRARSCRPQRCP
ncbi:hypothetical protein WME94_12865 [Sorangium sp. So ce429]